MTKHKAQYLTYKSPKLRFGPGGPECRCCLPMKQVDKINRFVRHKLKQELKKELTEIE